MKQFLYVTLFSIGMVGLTVQCQQSKQVNSANSNELADSSISNNVSADSNSVGVNDTALFASLEVGSETLRLQDSLPINFKVTNPSVSTLKFTTYHTPFEGLKSKFLIVKDSDGNEVPYQGPMVKRVMPPPADTYRELKAGDSQSVTFDLKKVYKIEKAGTYTLQYNAEAISGVKNGQGLTINIVE